MLFRALQIIHRVSLVSRLVSTRLSTLARASAASGASCPRRVPTLSPSLARRRRAHLWPGSNEIVQFLLERVLRPRRALAFVAHVRGVAPQRLFAQFLRAHLSRRLRRVRVRASSTSIDDSTTRVVRRPSHRSRARWTRARARRRVGRRPGRPRLRLTTICAQTTDDASARARARDSTAADDAVAENHALNRPARRQPWE